MKKLLITFDDETAHLLSKHPNMSQIVRESVAIYNEHISTDTLNGIRASYAVCIKLLREMDSKIDYIAGKVQQ